MLANTSRRPWQQVLVPPTLQATIPREGENNHGKVATATATALYQYREE